MSTHACNDLPSDDKNELYMREALSEGRQALIRGEVPVGCVFVFGGEIVARAGNEVNATKNATRHAELVALERLFSWCEERKLVNEDVLKVES